jgi:ATP-dependent Lhr-like helicase
LNPVSPGVGFLGRDWPDLAALSHSFRHNTGTSLASTLNLAGIVVPGPKIPTLLNNRVLYRDGSPVAVLVSGEIEWIERLEPAAERLAEDALVKRQIGSPLLAYLR